MESEIKWLPLRLNILPLIDRQARTVLQLYLSTRQEIVDGDILSIRRLIAIKEEIAVRLKQIDVFYAKSALDERAKYIYSTRSLLAKILQQNNEFENIHDQEENSPLGVMQTPSKGTFREDFAIESTSTRRKQPSQQTNGQINKNTSSRSQYENSQRNIYLTQADKDPKVMRLSDLKNQPKSKSPFSIREQPPKTTERGTSRKIEQGTSKKGTSRKIQEVAELQREKEEMNSRLERSPFDIKKSFKDLSELVFTIKMTKEEYNEFMRLKRKNNHA